MKFRHYLIIAVLCASPFAFLFYQARYNSEVEFLFPSLQSKWILYSAEKISGTVEFRKQFQLDALPKRCEIKIWAMREFAPFVNHKPLEDKQSENNWKRARGYDIASLLNQGENIIAIRVSNPEGPPALLVEGITLKTAKGKIALHSDTDWQAASEPDFTAWTPVVLPLTDPSRLGEKKGPVQLSSRYPIYMILFGAYILFILLAVNPGIIFYKPPANQVFHPNVVNNNVQVATPDIYSSRIARLQTFLKWNYPYLAIIIIMLVVNVHNTVLYPYTRSGFDWGGHVEYIKHMTSKWRAPLATDGWEMFQPPFYYFCSAIIYKLFGGEVAEPGSLKAVQMLGTLSGVANACFAWFVLRKLFPTNRAIQLLGFSVVAFLPMCIYMNPLISNEIFSGAVISLTIYLLIKYGFEANLKLKHIIILGASIGLALLSKYTGFFIFLTATTILAIRVFMNPEKRRRMAMLLAIFLVIVGVLCGWLYARNFVKFHDPFIGNWDKKSGFHYEQHHGYRTLDFYLKFGSVFFHNPERTRWASFWDGKYGSMWMDTHGSFLNLGDKKTNLYGSIILYLALLPSVAILLGFYQSVKSILKSARCNPNLALVMVSAFTIISLISFTMEVPFYSTIKAFFYLSLLPPIAVFAGSGLYTMCRNLGKFRFLVYANLIILNLLILNLFWYRGT